MSFTNVNGVWRDATSMTCVNGVWRESTEWTNVNGVWRATHTPSSITPDTINVFEIIYTRIRDIRYDEFPDLRDNRNIPSIARVGGTLPVEEYSTEPRSFIFEYSNDLPKEEGLAVYQGLLCAVMKNGTMINISDITNDSDISIKINGYSIYESYGPDAIGWNQIFSNEDNLPAKYHTDKNKYIVNSYPILPVYNRSKSYASRALIGIAREMTNRYINMVGSHGLLDHTYESIELNGTLMPFRISIYN